MNHEPLECLQVSTPTLILSGMANVHISPGEERRKCHLCIIVVVIVSALKQEIFHLQWDGPLYRDVYSYSHVFRERREVSDHSPAKIALCLCD